MVALLGTLALLGAILFYPQQVVAGDLYDRPLTVRHQRLKADPLNPQARRQVSCFSYARFVVKQVDLGEVGADRLSIIPVVSGRTTPCRQAKEKNEWVIPGDSWSGYFKGVKSDFVFFDAADGINGGLGFMVLRASDNRKLFEDTAKNGLESIAMEDGKLSIRYRRVFASRCSAVTGGATCRESIAKEAGVDVESLASCKEQYQTEKKEMAKARCEIQSVKDGSCLDKELAILEQQKWDDVPTVIEYEVEVRLDRPSPNIRPLGAALACRPSD